MNKTKKTILENPKTGEPMTREEAVHYQCPDIEEYDRMFAAGYNQTMEEEEEKYAQKHALEYKRENDVLRVQIQEQRKSHEMEIARLKAYYEAEIKKVKHERNLLAHGTIPVAEDLKHRELKLPVSEIVEYVKEIFSKSGAQEVSTMLFQFAIDHKFLEIDVLKQISGIIPAIQERDRHQNHIGITTAAQVNINPQQVINHTKEEKE